MELLALLLENYLTRHGKELGIFREEIMGSTIAWARRRKAKAPVQGSTWPHALHGVVPLKAMVDGRPVLAPGLDDEAWNALRRTLRQKSSEARFECGARAWPRVSQLGTKHFFHERDAACGQKHKPMSAAHLQLQDMVVRVCLHSGWMASTEEPVGNRRADVLAAKGSRRVVFEVQLASESHAGFVDRTRDYQVAGVEVVWLVPGRRARGNLRGLPVAAVRRSQDRHLVDVGDAAFPLTEFIQGVLTGRLRFAATCIREHVAQEQTVLRSADCPACHTRNLLVEKQERKGIEFRCGKKVLDQGRSQNYSTVLPPEEEHMEALELSGLRASYEAGDVCFATSVIAGPRAGLWCSRCGFDLGHHPWPTIHVLPGRSDERTQSRENRPHWCRGSPRCSP